VLVATALTATSIAISVQVLSELGKMQTKEAKLILGAAIVDDILSIAALSVVATMVQVAATTMITPVWMKIMYKKDKQTISE
jgi:Kef-type K+ transport system membrane component KefB